MLLCADRTQTTQQQVKLLEGQDGEDGTLSTNATHRLCNPAIRFLRGGSKLACSSNRLTRSDNHNGQSLMKQTKRHKSCRHARAHVIPEGTLTRKEVWVFRRSFLARSPEEN